jgi:hypothetical protein
MSTPINLPTKIYILMHEDSTDQYKDVPFRHSKPKQYFLSRELAIQEVARLRLGFEENLGIGFIRNMFGDDNPSEGFAYWDAPKNFEQAYWVSDATGFAKDAKEVLSFVSELAAGV